MNRSSRLKNILNRRQDLWDDSESETSSISDHDNMKRSTGKKSLDHSDQSSSDENSQPSPKRTCCLICSVLPNLTHVNTCPKHLASLTTPIPPAQVVYMMHPPINGCSQLRCHCRSKSKHRCRSSSSSSTSSSTRHDRKKRTMTVLSSGNSTPDDLFFSPDVPSTEKPMEQGSNYTQARLSPSLPPSSTINTNLQRYDQLLFTSILHRTEQENPEEIEFMLNNTQNLPDMIELNSDSACSSPIVNHQIIHVKDDGDDVDRKTMSINMAQVTEEMHSHQYPQPVILLKRVCLEDYPLLLE